MQESVYELTNNPVLLRIMELLKLQGKTEKGLIAWLGLANGTFTKWKYKNVKSYRVHLDRIAEYLEVTPEYLTKGVDDILTIGSMTPSEVRLIQLYRKMGEDQKKTVLKTADFFAIASNSEA